MKKIFIIKISEVGQRFDKFIAQNWPELSRAYLQKQIRQGKVLIKDQVKKPSYILKENDKIEAQISPLPEISLEPDPSIKLNIAYEDNDVIVVDKPAGLAAHPSATQKNGTLVNALLAHYPLLKDIGDDLLRPGLVHRLDKDTSGLMIVAKNNQAFEFLKNRFKNREVQKKYLALVIGRPKKSSGEIKTFISRSKSDPTKQKVSISNGKEAITLYRTLKKFRDLTLLEAIPKTGRMHQIRVQFAWLGNPVAGDKKYGSKKLPCPNSLKRQFLHASYLKIKLPQGKIKKFCAPLPPDLQKVLSNLETK